jgi:hypothetical protein
MPIPATFPWVAAQGIDDETYLKMLRDDMDDPPIPYSESFATTATTPFVRLNQYPVYDADTFLTVTNTANPGGLTLVDSRSRITSDADCYVEPETGYVYVDSAADTAGLSVTHYKVRWTNRRMLNNLYAGLKAMFPRVWQRKFVVVNAAVNQWEYRLTNDFLDPRTHVFRVEHQEIPFATTPYFRRNTWYMVDLATIHIPWSQEVTPGSNIRVHYAAPYMSLSELEPQVQHLPLWYAKGKLLLDKEVLRSRFDLGPVAQNEQQYPPGTSGNAGMLHLQMFENELVRLARPLPIAAMGSVYAR